LISTASSPSASRRVMHRLPAGASSRFKRLPLRVSNHVVPLGIARGGGAGWQTEFGNDVGDFAGYRLLADYQPVGDLSARLARRDEAALCVPGGRARLSRLSRGHARSLDAADIPAGVETGAHRGGSDGQQRWKPALNAFSITFGELRRYRLRALSSRTPEQCWKAEWANSSSSAAPAEGAVSTASTASIHAADTPGQ
jgi:hypothetical protein